jgi:hypothetical protein
MYKPNVVGFHTTLTDEVREHILSFAARGLVIGQVARLSRTPRETLRRWLKKGEEEANLGNSTIYSQLWVEFEERRGDEIDKMLQDVKARKTNWQASWELLRSVAREDFGMDSYEFKELLDMYLKLREDFKRLKDKPLQGTEHVKELDSVGNCQ